jgi:hypothetical protein
MLAKLRSHRRKRRSGGWRRVGVSSASPESAEGKASALQAQSPFARSRSQGQEGTPTRRQDPPAAAYVVRTISTLQGA